MLRLLVSAGLVLAVSASPVLYLHESGAEALPRMRREAEAQFIMASPYEYLIPAAPAIYGTHPYASPRVTYTAPNVASAPSVVNTPNVAYKPTMYAANPVANPVANPEPFLFGSGGMFGGGRNYLNNNIGGKAEYGYGYGQRRYPTYGDYYRTHRYPLNDGWMNWDEDLRDKDTAKADKFGGKKDGGR